MGKGVKSFVLFVIFYVAVVFLVFLSEHKNPSANINTISNAFWYSIVTFSTVGYGDYYPVTWIGRTLSLFFILGSFGLISFIVSQINLKIQHYMEAKKYGINGKNMEEHTVIFGYNDISVLTISEILNVGKRVVVVSNSKEDIEHLKDKFPQKDLFCYLCEYDDYEKLDEISIEKSSSVFVNFTDDTETLLHVVNLQSHYKGLKIIVNLKNPRLKNTFASAGVVFSISQEEIASKLIASYTFGPNAAMLTEDLMNNQVLSEHLDMQEYLMTKDSPLVGKTYQDCFISLKKDYNAVLAGIYKSKENKLYKNPSQNLDIELEDRLILLADTNGQNLEEVFKIPQGI